MLAGQVALVTGASRGVGRGIALQLGKAGATVYVTGRAPNQRNDDAHKFRVPELQDTAKEVTRRGGKGIAVYCDHSKEDDVKNVFEQISREQNNRLDILVNNAFAAVTEVMGLRNVKYYNQPLSMFDKVNNVGLRNHYVCAVLAAKIMAPRRKGLIVTVGSSGGIHYLFNVAYGIGKAACDRMAADIALELKDDNVTSIALWPGAVKTELVEQTIFAKPNAAQMIFKDAESVEFAGKCLVHFAADPNHIKKTGRIVTTTELAIEYSLRDEDGSVPRNAHAEIYKEFLDNLNRVRTRSAIEDIKAHI